MRTYAKDEAPVKKRKRTITLKSRVYIILLLLIACFGIYFCMESPIFNIKHIEVKGNKFTSAENIISAAKIRIGENIFKINANNNEKYIKEISFIKEANIKRVLPTNIVIEVTEKNPLLIINQAGSYIFIDDELTVLKQQSRVDDFDIPLLSNIKIQSAVAGQTLQAEKVWILDMVYKMTLNLRQAGVLANVSEFYITDENAVNIYTKGGSVIKIANQKIFEDNFEFIYTILYDDNMSGSIELMDNGNHIYKKIK